MCVSASGRTNTSLRGMDYGLTTAVFGYTRNLNKNADLRRQGNMIHDIVYNDVMYDDDVT